MNAKTLIATLVLSTFLCGGLYAQLLEPVKYRPEVKAPLVATKAEVNEIVEKQLKGINEVPVEEEIKAEEPMYREAESLAYKSDARERRAVVKNMEQLKVRTSKFAGEKPLPEIKINVNDREAVRDYLLNETVNLPKVPLSLYDNI